MMLLIPNLFQCLVKQRPACELALRGQGQQLRRMVYLVLCQQESGQEVPRNFVSLVLIELHFILFLLCPLNSTPC